MKKTITRARETVKLDAMGNLVTYAVYSFMLDDLGPFTIEIPKTEASTQRIKEAIAAQEKMLEEIKELERS